MIYIYIITIIIREGRRPLSAGDVHRILMADICRGGRSASGHDPLAIQADIIGID